MSDYLPDDDLLLMVRAARPAVPQEAVSPTGPAARATLERVLASDPDHKAGRALDNRRRDRFAAKWTQKLRPDVVVPAVSVVVAVVVAVVFLSLRGAGSSTPVSPSGRDSLELVYRAEPTPQVPVVTSAALNRTVEVLRGRIRQLGVAPGASVRIVGTTEIAVMLPKLRNEQLAERLLGANAQLEFYDWEANALAPNGQTVASQLGRAKDPEALQISQGGSIVAPGSAGAGSLPLYQAVQLASRQPEQASSDNARAGNEYYLFGAPGSHACTESAELAGSRAVPHEHCLLAGPIELPAATRRPAVDRQLSEWLPLGVKLSDGQLFVIRQGTIVLQAAPANFSDWPPFGSPATTYYVLKDHVALFGNEITNPRQSTDSTGAPDVSFGFTESGTRAFHKLTATVAERGQLVSTAGETLDQHFAIALDNQLITVPSIDFRAYPDGISGDEPADISVDISRIMAQNLAGTLRLGALPIRLTLIGETSLGAHN